MFAAIQAGMCFERIPNALGKQLFPCLPLDTVLLNVVRTVLSMRCLSLLSCTDDALCLALVSRLVFQLKCSISSSCKQPRHVFVSIPAAQCVSRLPSRSVSWRCTSSTGQLFTTPIKAFPTRTRPTACSPAIQRRSNTAGATAGASCASRRRGSMFPVGLDCLGRTIHNPAPTPESSPLMSIIRRRPSQCRKCTTPMRFPPTTAATRR